MGKVHKQIQEWLISTECLDILRKEHGVKIDDAQSGDEQQLEIIRKKEMTVPWNPDVTYKMKNGTYYIIEIAFEEDWRAKLGELLLAYLHPDVSFIHWIVKEKKDKGAIRRQNREIEKIKSMTTILYHQFNTRYEIQKDKKIGEKFKEMWHEENRYKRQWYHHDNQISIINPDQNFEGIKKEIREKVFPVLE
tara:strand:+ start:563 stop:1138 length:576 start_codon:yes stop_codon:yes gene_type:complete